MKNKNPRFPAILRRHRILNKSFNPWLATSIALLLVSPALRAAPLTWDSDADFLNGVTDGSGTWDMSTANWFNGTLNVAWDNLTNDTAILGNGSTGGSGISTVTLGTGITVGGLTFNASSTTGSYNIAGASNVLTFGGTSTPVFVTANANATISAELAVPDLVGPVVLRTLTKAGPAILGLSGGGTVTFVRSGPATGSLFLTSGTYTVGGMNFYDKGIVTDDDGIVFQTGGDVITSKNWDGRFNAAPYDITGGTLNSTGTGSIRGIGKFNASGNAEVTFNAGDPRIASDNVSGTLSINDSASVSFSSSALITLVNGGAGTTHTGTVNLSGGTLTTAGIVHGTGAPATTSSFINFNGGTLRANSNSGAGFFGANPLNTASIYGGGITVDSNGKSIGIGQPLLATTGNGIDTVTITDGGSLYTTAPSVTFSGGGGTDATGYALIDLSGVVTSVVITNPGRDYTSTPTVTFSSGAATATATAALVNSNGGLTKTGNGTLTLTGANTYTGTTTIHGGTLKFTQPGLADSSTVKIDLDGVLLLDYNGTDNVAALIINDVPMADGLYDNTTLGISGNGKLQVGIVENVYATWEESNGISGAGADADSDNDGISNGIEFVIGGDPSGPDSDSTSLLQPVVVDANNLTYVYHRTTASASYHPFVEYSSDLAAWTKAENGVNAVTITEDLGFYGTGIDKVTVVVPRSLADGSKFFARLKVTIP